MQMMEIIKNDQTIEQLSRKLAPTLGSFQCISNSVMNRFYPVVIGIFLGCFSYVIIVRA